MATRSERIEFVGSDGATLAGRLDWPEGNPVAFALWAHCFSCTKDVFAASRVANGLAAHGIAVLRFDFTGLGASDGDFANTNFSSNIDDLIAAANYMRKNLDAPSILIGHSLGGAAVLAAAPKIPEAKAVCTIGAPADPNHVAHHFLDSREEIEKVGEAEVLLGGRPFRIKQQFLEDIANQKLLETIKTMKRALLVFHSPIDSVVGIDNASQIFQAAKHPKSFVSLDNADHLLSGKSDASFVADVIAAWARRIISKGEVEETQISNLSTDPGTVVVSETGKGKFANAVSIGGKHTLISDEPVGYGGTDTGPTPYDLLLAGLGACKSMTMRMYADRKGINLDRSRITLTHSKIHASDCSDCETQSGQIDKIDVSIEVTGDMDAEARRRIVEIADKCPVHRTLHSEVKIESRLTDQSEAGSHD